MSEFEPEFSHLINPRKIDAEPVELIANETQRADLAKRFGIVSVKRLEATIELEPKSSGVLAQGELSADIVQSCAVTGEEIGARINELLTLKFVPAKTEEHSEEEIELDAEELDEIEYSGERIDLGEAVAQTLALAIDPFAEGPNAEAYRKEKGLVGDDQPSGPLAEALASLKKD